MVLAVRTLRRKPATTGCWRTEWCAYRDRQRAKIGMICLWSRVMETKIENIIKDVKPEQHPLPETQWYGKKPATTPKALIKYVLPETGVAAIIGQSGTGKTFHAL